MANTLELEKIHLVASEAVTIGRKILLDYFGRLSKVSEKEQAGLVSEADVASERAITQHLEKHFPPITMIGEESSYQAGVSHTQIKRQGSQWILDPLDGTTNYVHGFHIYCISLALESEGQTVYGIIDVPSLNTTYHAIKNGGAFKNGQPIRVSDRENLNTALVVTGFASSKPAVLPLQLEVFSKVIGQVRGARRTGSAAYDLCMVADGVFDVYWENDLSSWDIAAGALIVQEAGGSVTGCQNQKFNPHERDILATNGHVHSSMVSLVSTLRPVKK